MSDKLPSQDKRREYDGVLTEQELDEALADTFPASDPVSATTKGRPTAPPQHDDDREDGKKARLPIAGRTSED